MSSALSDLISPYRPSPLERAYCAHLLVTYFNTAVDLINDNAEIRVTGRNAVPFLTTSGLERRMLRSIWSFVDPDGVGTLTSRNQFYTILRLIAMAQAHLLPPLPHELDSQQHTLLLKEALSQNAHLVVALPTFTAEAKPPTVAHLLGTYNSPPHHETPSITLPSYSDSTSHTIRHDPDESDINLSHLLTDHDLQYQMWKKYKQQHDEMTHSGKDSLSMQGLVSLAPVTKMSVSDAFADLPEVEDRPLPLLPSELPEEEVDHYIENEQNQVSEIGIDDDDDDDDFGDFDEAAISDLPTDVHSAPWQVLDISSNENFSESTCVNLPTNAAGEAVEEERSQGMTEKDDLDDFRDFDEPSDESRILHDNTQSTAKIPLFQMQSITPNTTSDSFELACIDEAIFVSSRTSSQLLHPYPNNIISSNGNDNLMCSVDSECIDESSEKPFGNLETMSEMSHSSSNAIPVRQPIINNDVPNAIPSSNANDNDLILSISDAFQKKSSPNTSSHDIKSETKNGIIEASKYADDENDEFGGFEITNPMSQVLDVDASFIAPDKSNSDVKSQFDGDTFSFAGPVRETLVENDDIDGFHLSSFGKHGPTLSISDAFASLVVADDICSATSRLATDVNATANPYEDVIESQVSTDYDVIEFHGSNISDQQKIIIPDDCSITKELLVESLGEALEHEHEDSVPTPTNCHAKLESTLIITVDSDVAVTVPELLPIRLNQAKCSVDKSASELNNEECQPKDFRLFSMGLGSDEEKADVELSDNIVDCNDLALKEENISNARNNCIDDEHGMSTPFSLSTLNSRESEVLPIGILRNGIVGLTNGSEGFSAFDDLLGGVLDTPLPPLERFSSRVVEGIKKQIEHDYTVSENEESFGDFESTAVTHSLGVDFGSQDQNQGTTDELSSDDMEPKNKPELTVKNLSTLDEMTLDAVTTEFDNAISSAENTVEQIDPGSFEDEFGDFEEYANEKSKLDHLTGVAMQQEHFDSHATENLISPAVNSVINHHNLSSNHDDAQSTIIINGDGQHCIRRGDIPNSFLPAAATLSPKIIEHELLLTEVDIVSSNSTGATTESILEKGVNEVTSEGPDVKLSLFNEAVLENSESCMEIISQRYNQNDDIDADFFRGISPSDESITAQAIVNEQPPHSLHLNPLSDGENANIHEEDFGDFGSFEEAVSSQVEFPDQYLSSKEVEITNDHVDEEDFGDFGSFDEAVSPVAEFYDQQLSNEQAEITNHDHGMDKNNETDVDFGDFSELDAAKELIERDFEPSASEELFGVFPDLYTIASPDIRSSEFNCDSNGDDCKVGDFCDNLLERLCIIDNIPKSFLKIETIIESFNRCSEIGESNRQQLTRCVELCELLAENPCLLMQWEKIVSCVKSDVERGKNILNYFSKEFSSVDRTIILNSMKLSNYILGLREFVRIVRLIAATVGDILCLNKNVVLDEKSLSDWGNNQILSDVIIIEDMWSVITSMSKDLYPSSHISQIDSIVEMRAKILNLDRSNSSGELCQLTLQPVYSECSSCPTMNSVVWDGKRYIVCVANFWANRMLS